MFSNTICIPAINRVEFPIFCPDRLYKIPTESDHDQMPIRFLGG